MGKVIEKLKGEQGIEVKKVEINPGEQMKEKMVSSFADVELKIDGLGKLNYFCFHYLPSSVELLDDTELKFSSRDFTNYLNDTLATIHHYNVLVTNLNAEKQLREKSKA